MIDWDDSTEPEWLKKAQEAGVVFTTQTVRDLSTYCLMTANWDEATQTYIVPTPLPY